MNLQLHHVVSDVTGVTGMKIIRAIAAGQRDPAVLATMRDVRCKAITETVRAALVGNYQAEHVFELTQALAIASRRDANAKKIPQARRAVTIG